MAKILRPGHNSADLRDPIFWDSEDWSPEEWKALCKIFGLPPGVTERMVLHASELEYFISSPDKAVDYERTYTVTEYCPHCENEIEMRWDTDTRGFKAFCPVCGKRLMLCDECRHTGRGGGCDYSSETDSCRYNPQTISDIIDSKEPAHCSEQSVSLEMSTMRQSIGFTRCRQNPSSSAQPGTESTSTTSAPLPRHHHPALQGPEGRAVPAQVP